MVKNLPAVQETRVVSLGQEDPLEKGIATPPIFLLGEFHGQRYSSWGCKESDMTEKLTLSLSYTYTHTHTHIYIQFRFEYLSIVSCH